MIKIHRLKEKFQSCKVTDVIEIGMKKSVGKERLETLQNEIEAAQEKLNLVNKAFKIKYEKLKEACSQAQRLQNYVEQLKNGQDYHELEAIVRSEVGKTLLDNKKVLQSNFLKNLQIGRETPAQSTITS